MPRLGNSKAERMAQFMAQGMSATDAHSKAGFKGATHTHRFTSRPEFKARVAELCVEIEKKTMAAVIDSRQRVHADIDFLWSWATQVNEVDEPCPKCSSKFENLFDMKHAVKLIEYRGLEQGMFKRSLDVTSRRVTQIEGSQDEVLEKFAQLLEKLGISAISQLLDRLGDDTLTAAMKLIGYEVAKPNGRDVEQIGAASGGDGDVDGTGKPDAQRLRSSSEAAPVS